MAGANRGNHRSLRRNTIDQARPATPLGVPPSDAGAVAPGTGQSPRNLRPICVSLSRTSFKLVTPKFLHSSKSSPVL